ncbi:ISAs1 family transposase [Thiorhodococcus minor]|uniref:ISAs1 family transposase n=1 Tax=Thiorhodococcus minor TaxID=57489 RepID=A0A6M0K479_9GAMM|nr:ISAs1 family transposase [Thiorhodococcus minor]NEV64061.1 ISAs1 family transposase [Thiorhodococcus minor]
MPEMTLDRSLMTHFAPLEDPRCALKRRHKLLDMIVITIAGTLCGADGRVQIAELGRARRAWLSQVLELPDGIPAHDTFGRVFSLLRPEAFEACFRDWVEAIREVIPGEVIAVDGKTLRRSHDRGKGLAALHLVSTWATANRVVLGQVATDAKSNEITAIPQVLELLHLSGCIVTIDAMGCQSAIAEQIVAQGGDYVLALKGSQSTLAAEVEEAFIEADAREYADVASEVLETTEQGHGRREETRRYRTLGDLSGVPRSALREGMNMIGMVESERALTGKTTRETRFSIGSIGTDVETFAQAVRGHWGVENQLHWSLDVSFNEDGSSSQEGETEAWSEIRSAADTRSSHFGLTALSPQSPMTGHSGSPHRRSPNVALRSPRFMRNGGLRTPEAGNSIHSGQRELGAGSRQLASLKRQPGTGRFCSVALNIETAVQGNTAFPVVRAWLSRSHKVHAWRSRQAGHLDRCGTRPRHLAPSAV